MGAWGTSLYADDTTCDVRDRYVENLRRGDSDVEAARYILRQHRGVLRNRDISCLVYFALADTQWRYGRLQDAIKKRSLTLIASGGDLASWERDGGKAAKASRAKHLKALKSRLLSEPRPRRRVPVIKPRATRPRTDTPVGTVFLVPLSKRTYGALVLIGHMKDEKSVEPIFSGLNWRGRHLPSPSVLKRCARVSFESALGPRKQVGLLNMEDRKNPMAALVRTSTVITTRIRADPNNTVFLFLEGVVRRLGKTSP